MNLVGKIFVVLILVLSVVFGSFAVAVYATHKNWREVVMSETESPVTKQKGLVYQLKDARAKNEQLNEQLQKLEQEKAAVKKDKDQAVAKLENERDVVRKEHEDLQKQYAEKDKALRDAVAALQTTQLNTSNLRTEVAGLRTDIEKAQKDRDANFKEVVRLTDELNQRASELQRLQTLSVKLEVENARLRLLLNTNHIPLDAQPRPAVDGVITAVRQDGLVEISLGKDDGVAQKQLFDISRAMGGGNEYVGRCEVIEVEATKAVCKIDKKFLQKPVQRGDRVFSKR